MDLSGSVKDRWQVIVNTAMDFGAQEYSGDVFKRRATVVVTKKTLQNGIKHLFTKGLFNNTASLSDCVGLMRNVRVTNELDCGNGRGLI